MFSLSCQGRHWGGSPAWQSGREGHFPRREGCELRGGRSHCLALVTGRGAVLRRPWGGAEALEPGIAAGTRRCGDGCCETLAPETVC